MPFKAREVLAKLLQAGFEIIRQMKKMNCVPAGMAINKEFG